MFRYRDDLVDVAPDMLEVDVANALGAKSISGSTRHLFGGKLNDLAGTQTGLGIGGKFGFNADHIDFGVDLFDGGRDAADQAAATDGRDDSFDVGQFLKDFQSDGALTGDDLFVVVGRHNHVTVLSGEFF